MKEWFYEKHYEGGLWEYIAKRNDEEVLAHIVEYYCKNKNCIPTESEICLFRDYIGVLAEVAYSSDPAVWDIKLIYGFEEELPLVELILNDSILRVDFVRVSEKRETNNSEEMNWSDFIDYVHLNAKVGSFSTNSLSVIIDKTWDDSSYEAYAIIESGNEYWGQLPSESFGFVVKEMMDRDGLCNFADIARKSNLSRQVVNRVYNYGVPTTEKNTILALSIGLELSIADTQRLLGAAGYSFAPGDIRDCIIKAQIESGNNNIEEINNLLYERGYKLLGSTVR